MTVTLILVGTLAGCLVLLGRLSHRLRREQERSADLKSDLAENNRRWSLLFSGADWGIALSNERSNTLSSVNHAFARMHGYSPEELVGMDVLSLFADERRDETLDMLRVAQKEGRRSWDSVHVRKDGSRFPVSISLSVIRNDKGEIVYHLVNVRDLTEPKRLEAERRSLESELQTAQRLESIGKLAGGVAHDFNNMLLVIQGHAELAMMHSPPGSPVHAHLETIHLATRKSSDLTRRLLAFARKQAVEPKDVDPNAAIENLLKMLRRLIGENIRFAWSPKPDVWKIRVDPGQFDQILTNLCVNARDAIAGAGTISIETINREIHPEDRFASKGVRPGQYVSISVSDDGSGMDAATLSRIFEPFFTTKDPGAGTGLGLATVYGATRQNNGHIDVRSVPGKGTEFTILLPRDTSPASMLTDASAGDALFSGNETLLVVEDESAILAMMCSILELHGYEVLQAKTPSEALAAIDAHQGPIHLLVSDVVMPGMNGLELLSRSRARRPDLKHLFVSGHFLEGDALSAGGYRSERYLQKPFSIKEFVGMARRSLDFVEDRK